MAPRSAVARRAFADSRARNLSFAAFFALYAYAQAVAYPRAYSTVAQRQAFAATFGDNKAIRLFFYGVPHDLLTTGGHAAWRVGGALAICAGMWGSSRQ